MNYTVPPGRRNTASAPPGGEKARERPFAFSGVLSAACTIGATAALLGCGGGDPTAGSSATAQSAPAPRARALATADTNALSAAEAAGQLFNFAEQSDYKTSFPGHSPTLSSAPFAYRYYAETNTYLGVAVGNGSPPYQDGHVYVMGGAFPSAPSDVGLLSAYLNPSKAFAGVWTGQLVASVGGAQVKVHAVARADGELMMFAYEDCHVYSGSYYTNAASVVYTSTAEWKFHCFGATEQAPKAWDGTGAVAMLQKTMDGVGTATARSDATVSYKSALVADRGSVQLSYSALYERSSSLAKLAGSYSTMHPGTAGMVATSGSSITVSADGSFIGTETASNGVGLVKRSYTGQFSLIDATRNLYALSVSVDGVAMIGYAFMDDSAAGKTDDGIRLVAKQAGWGPFVHYFVKK